MSAPIPVLSYSRITGSSRQKGKDKLLAWLDATYNEISVYLDFPTAHWSRIKCTNSLERLNEELRGREKCIWIFPNEMSCLRLFGAILQGYSEDWISGRLYLSKPLERIRENLIRPIQFDSAGDGLEPCSVGYASSAGLQPVVGR
ncbi:MAG TPA: transposase [Methanofastidiosum sp.]|nr:transposase [Methanofastidiosum sp.]